MFDWIQGLFGSAAAAPQVATDGIGGYGPTNPLAGAMAQQGGARTEGDALSNMLRGVRAPTAPETQRLSLPSNAPSPRAPTPIKGGDLVALLQMMEGGYGQVKSPYTLPSTLGGALTGRR